MNALVLTDVKDGVMGRMHRNCLNAMGAKVVKKPVFSAFPAFIPLISDNINRWSVDTDLYGVYALSERAFASRVGPF